MQRVILSLILIVYSISSWSASDPHPEILRVMTYNTYYVFDHSKQIEEGKKWVKSQTADIVALQELTSIKPELLQELAESWNHKHSALLKTSGFSVGLTSRYPIEVIEKGFSGMHHGYLHAKTAGINVFVVHLSPFKHTVRSSEVDILLAKIKPLMKANEKVMVLGDFNAFHPDDKKLIDPQEKLKTDMANTDKKYGYVENLKDGEFGYSALQKFVDAKILDTGKKKQKMTIAERMTIPTGIWTDKKTAPEFGHRVDFIMACPQLFPKVYKSKNFTVGVVNQISDHYPVITDFKITIKTP